VPLVLALALPRAPALASGEVRAPHVTAALVAETASLEPGREVAAGLRLDLEPGWHVYWRNPGDSGEPPRIIWHLPPGFHAGEIGWPSPARIPVGPLANFGYGGSALFATTLSVPTEL